MAPPPDRYLSRRREQDVLVLTILPAKIQDDEMAEALRQELLAAVADTTAPKVVIDFQNTKYLSSVALRPLLHLRQKLQEIGGRLILCGMSFSIGDVFYTTRLASSTGSVAPFQIEPDVAAAVARLRSPTETRNDER